MSAPPSNLGSYPIERELGRGGMGVVYLARDPRLNRQVAIKILGDLITLNPDTLARFDREAKLLASLNHPNIAAIYGIEEAGPQQFLVLEYVPGETLASLIARGPLPIADALDICRQIALAVEAAHEGGVIHRDLKPGNVKITPDGVVKVLDFGLAKGAAPDGRGNPTNADVSPHVMPTMTSPAMTAMGIILGTAGYMSPEQARGKPVDRRTDIWSFGCVLFECLTGRQPFEGETVSDTIAKILEREPDWSALPANTPLRIRELLRRCFERDVKRRQRDIGDVRLEIEEAIAARGSSSKAGIVVDTSTPAFRWRSPRVLGLAALCLAIGAAIGIGVWSRAGFGGTGASLGTARLAIDLPREIRATYLGFTTDGQSLLMFGFPKNADGSEGSRARIYSRRFDTYEFKPIPGTDGAENYTRSPDGKWLAIVATVSEQSAERRLMKVSVDGSTPPVLIADWPESWDTSMAWLESDELVVLADFGTKLIRQPVNGGAPSAPLTVDTGSVSGFLDIRGRLPGDRGVFLDMEMWGPRGYQSDLWVVNPKTAKAQRVLERVEHATYSSTGHLVFTRGDAVMAVPFDESTLAVSGDVTAIFAGVRSPADNLELAPDGKLLYAPGGLVGKDRRLVVIDASGSAKPFTPERREYEAQPAVAPDGQRLAVVIPNDKGTFEIWIADRDRPGLRRFAARPNADCGEPVWSHDGKRLAYLRMARDKDDGVYVQRADGSDEPRLVAATGSRDVILTPTSWTPDGAGLLVTRRTSGLATIIFVPIADVGPPAQPRVLRVNDFDEDDAHISPDGQFVAFSSKESGKRDVYVAPYGKDGSIGRPVLVSNDGGHSPQWSGNSRTLIYFSEPNRLISANIATAPVLSASAPKPLHDLKKLRLLSYRWTVMPDGRVLGTENGETEDDVSTYHVILNWFDELRARVPGKR